MSTAYVALPNIQGNLSAAPDQVGWVITAFVVATAIGTILTNLFSQKFGRRQIFLASIAGFTITSLFAGTSGSLSELVFHRMLQGFVSAPLLPISQAIMLDTYPKEKHGFAMSIWSMGMILGPVAGPTVGAVLTEFYDWRYVFYMNIPFGLVAFFSILVTLPSARSMHQRTDWLGVVSLIVAVVCLQLVLDRGERLGWFESSEILFNAMLSGLAFYIFIMHSVTTKTPYISLKIFSDRNYVIGLTLIFTFGIAVFASLFILPLFLQNVQGYPCPLGRLGDFLARTWDNGCHVMLGVFVEPNIWKILILFGLLCVGVSNLWMTSWNADVGMEEVIWITIINGFGMGMMWVALTTVTFSTLPTVFRVEAAALFSLIRAIGASIGTSLVVSILVRSTQTNYIEMRAQITEFKAAINLSGLDGVVNIGSEMGLRNIQSIVLSEAHMMAFLNDFVFLMIVAFAAIPLIFLLRSKT
jgi:DHA2 family multidrug resistance protein